MRLFRRFLLCLVVGVTAFGAAGWMLRPKPSWTLDLPDRRCEFVEHIDTSNDEPTWVVVPDKRLLAISVRDGAEMHSIPWPRTGNYLPKFASLAAGRLAVEFHFDGDISKRRFELFEIGRNQPIYSTELGGDWRIADDLRHAWRLKWEDEHDPDGGRRRSAYFFECRDLWNNNPVHRREMSREIDHSGDDYIAYSAQADLLAMSASLLKGAKPPYSIELRRGTTGTIVKTIRIDLPENREGDGPCRLAFQSAGRWLTFDLLGNAEQDKKYAINTATSAIRRIDPPDAPPIEKFDDVEVSFTADGRCAAAFYGEEPWSIWASLIQPNEAKTHWRQVPADPSVIERGGLKPRAVPGRNAIVVRVITPSLGVRLPDSVSERLPLSSVESEEDAYLWFDADAGTWRTVLRGLFQSTPQVRPTALLTLARNGDAAVLQSWPLPPRDPKWPALGVALACAAGTWWVCAKRYRRRTHLASVGAA
jgi:hypothetical protein